MKGISTVIATLLMLVITLGLIGIAYGYITGIFGGRIAVVLSIDELTTCDSALNITVVLRNDGTTPIPLNETKIRSYFPDGRAANCTNGTIFYSAPCLCNTTGWLPAGGTAECGNKTQGAVGTNRIVAEGAGSRATGYKRCM